MTLVPSEISLRKQANPAIRQNMAAMKNAAIVLDRSIRSSDPMKSEATTAIAYAEVISWGEFIGEV